MVSRYLTDGFLDLTSWPPMGAARSHSDISLLLHFFRPLGIRAVGQSKRPVLNSGLRIPHAVVCILRYRKRSITVRFDDMWVSASAAPFSYFKDKITHYFCPFNPKKRTGTEFRLWGTNYLRRLTRLSFRRTRLDLPGHYPVCPHNSLCISLS